MRKKTLLKYGFTLTLVAAAPRTLAFIDSESTLRTGTKKNFDPQARLSPDGRSITLSGAIGPCEAREKMSEVQAQVTQETTFASASGTVIKPCQAGKPMRFLIKATVNAVKPAFVTGQAKSVRHRYLTCRRAAHRYRDLVHVRQSGVRVTLLSTLCDRPQATGR
jgi:hypothetical protein